MTRELKRKVSPLKAEEIFKPRGRMRSTESKV